jgi:U3 small nucleolar RNA-associated protein MPP10
VYAKEYENQLLGGIDEASDGRKAEVAEIDGIWAKLSHKLDALSNFHFKARPALPELGVKPSKHAAIRMEEVVPLAMTDAMARAPEEMDNKKRGREGVLRSELEMSTDERSARRRAKKTARRKKLRQMQADEKAVARLNPGMGNKYAQKQLLDDIAKERGGLSRGKAEQGADAMDYSKSATFFAKLQSDTQKTAASITGAVTGDDTAFAATGGSVGGGRKRRKKKGGGGAGANFMM